MALIDVWGAPLSNNPSSPASIMSLEELRAAGTSGAGWRRPAAVRLPPDTPLESIAPWLAAIDLICIEFPKFRDGRGFTLTRTLRERYRFTGDIRAIGHLLPDQLEALRLCGFSSVLTPDDHPPEQWMRPALPDRETKPPSAQLLNRLIARRNP